MEGAGVREELRLELRRWSPAAAAAAAAAEEEEEEETGVRISAACPTTRTARNVPSYCHGEETGLLHYHNGQGRLERKMEGVGTVP